MHTKEYQTCYYDYGFRQLDPQLGRWHVIDAMAEKYFSSSPYAYVENDPINHRDYLGLWKFPVYVNGVLDHYVYGNDGWDTANSTLGGGGGADLPSSYGDSGSSLGNGSFGESGGFGGGSGGSSGQSMYSRYLNSGAYNRGMRYSRWLDLQNKAARENGVGFARIAYEAGYNFEAEYGQSFVIIDNIYVYKGDYTMGYTLVYKSFMSWINSFDRPSGGIAEYWEGAHDGETKISTGRPDNVGIGLIMANASSQYENAAATPGWFSRTVDYIFHLFEGASKGNELYNLFTNNPEPVIATPEILLDTTYYDWSEGIDSCRVIEYQDSSVYIKYLFDSSSYKYTIPRYRYPNF